jgi:hypothetical protein
VGVKTNKEETSKIDKQVAARMPQKCRVFIELPPYAIGKERVIVLSIVPVKRKSRIILL